MVSAVSVVSAKGEYRHIGKNVVSAHPSPLVHKTPTITTMQPLRGTRQRDQTDIQMLQYILSPCYAVDDQKAFYINQMNMMNGNPLSKIIQVSNSGPSPLADLLILPQHS